MHITHRIRFELLLDLHEPLKVFNTFNEYLRVLIVDLERPNWLVYAVRGRDQNWTVVSLQSQSVSCSHHRRISESTKTKQQTGKWLSFNNVNTKLPSPALHRTLAKCFIDSLSKLVHPKPGILATTTSAFPSSSWVTLYMHLLKYQANDFHFPVTTISIL